jgi:NAD(P)H-hydrate epimerase
LPVVLDAGGVDALRGHLEVLKDRREPVILTPHPGEFSRLLGLPVTDIGARRIEFARTFAREHQVWLVLKGFRSIVADPEGGVRVCPLGNPGMATAGMGDVLSGVIGGLLAGHSARGTARGALHAASTGLYLHSLAGDLAAEELGVDALIAGDVIDFLSEALRSLRGDES